MFKIPRQSIKFASAAISGVYFAGAYGLFGHNTVDVNIDSNATYVRSKNNELFSCGPPSSIQLSVPPGFRFVNYFVIIYNISNGNVRFDTHATWRPNKFYLNGHPIENFQGIAFSSKNYNEQLQKCNGPERCNPL